MDKDPIFTLDRKGGREKIARAMYSPQKYRRENTANAGKSRWSTTLAVIIGVIVGLAFYKGW